MSSEADRALGRSQGGNNSQGPIYTIPVSDFSSPLQRRTSHLHKGMLRRSCTFLQSMRKAAMGETLQVAILTRLCCASLTMMHACSKQQQQRANPL